VALLELLGKLLDMAQDVQCFVTDYQQLLHQIISWLAVQTESLQSAICYVCIHMSCWLVWLVGDASEHRVVFDAQVLLKLMPYWPTVHVAPAFESPLATMTFIVQHVVACLATAHSDTLRINSIGTVSMQGWLVCFATHCLADSPCLSLCNVALITVLLRCHEAVVLPVLGSAPSISDALKSTLLSRNYSIQAASARLVQKLTSASQQFVDLLVHHDIIGMAANACRCAIVEANSKCACVCV
jgi:hypothetical protein